MQHRDATGTRLDSSTGDLHTDQPHDVFALAAGPRARRARAPNPKIIERPYLGVGPIPPVEIRRRHA